MRKRVTNHRLQTSPLLRKTMHTMTNPTKIILRNYCPRRCPAFQSKIIITTIIPQQTAVVRLLRRFKSTTTTTLSSQSSSSSYGARLWQLYVRNLEARPLLTKSIFSSLIFFVSDSATQYILPPTPANTVVVEEEEEENEHKKLDDYDDNATNQLDTSNSTSNSFWQQWDAPRALSAASFGVLATCYLHHWWNLLEFVLGRAIPIQRYRLANTMVKVVIDQGMAAPCYVYSYYTLTNFFQDLQEGKRDAVISWKETNAKASEMLWPTMMQHWKLWPMVHSINFYYIPIHHRVLVQNSVLVGWSGYLSHLNHGSGRSSIMTPDEEIKATIVRRESEKLMQLHQEEETKNQSH